MLTAQKSSPYSSLRLVRSVQSFAKEYLLARPAKVNQLPPSSGVEWLSSSRITRSPSFESHTRRHRTVAAKRRSISHTPIRAAGVVPCHCDRLNNQHTRRLLHRHGNHLRDHLHDDRLHELPYAAGNASANCILSSKDEDHRRIRPAIPVWRTRASSTIVGSASTTALFFKSPIPIVPAFAEGH